ncbi:MAG: branched-chain amino acid aminotransferase [Anaerolineae bacterium]|nr:branched-chain amino acid aminotransferase [Candidatus Roseilinea sp.]MDW8450891.1 branched-chain amino acid aminotransferase [Anaerolineae bacterium]
MNITIEPLGPNARRPLAEKPVFGKTFTNRMFTQRWTEEKGWHDAKIGPYQPLVLDPATAVFHYAQEIFEGTKAYRRPDGHINLFRPWENVARFNRSADRMAMQKVDPEAHLEAIVELVRLEHEWVPGGDGESLYIRPVMIATDVSLGVYASKSYLHYIIVGPAGAYFPTGFKPVSVFVSDEYVRAVRGGTGAAKTGGNYAASLRESERVKHLGYHQVLWLDAIERKYVEEVGAMNIAFVYGGKHIVTPELSGSILEGVTRDSVLKLAPDLGYSASEARLALSDVLRDIESGEITEVFGMGTAAVIAPVDKMGYRGKDYFVRNAPGPVANHLFKSLTDIQYGRVPDPYRWTYKIEVDGR